MFQYQIMIIVVSSFVFSRRFSGIALWPFVVVKHEHLKKDLVFLNHERIHLRQQIELLIVLFYLWYGLEYLCRLIQYKNGHLAYRNISFEREAYANEKDLQYVDRRSFWSFLKFL